MQARQLLSRLSLHHKLCYHRTNIAHQVANVTQLSMHFTNRLTTCYYLIDTPNNWLTSSTTAPPRRRPAPPRGRQGR